MAARAEIEAECEARDRTLAIDDLISDVEAELERLCGLREAGRCDNGRVTAGKGFAEAQFQV